MLDSALGNQAFMTRLFQISSKHVHHPLRAFFSADESDGFVVNQQFWSAAPSSFLLPVSASFDQIITA